MKRGGLISPAQAAAPVHDPDNQATVASKGRQVSRREEKMKQFLLAGALLLAVATLGPITRFVKSWARCAKRRRQEAMIHLAYERGLITKAEIDGMLKQVDEFDGKLLVRHCRTEKAMATAAHSEDERGTSIRVILSNWVIGWGKARTEMRPGRNVDRSGTDRGQVLAPLGQIRSVVFPRGEDERERQQRADYRVLKHLH
jgi:hypothetical protein